ncbi:MAG TPA: ferritin family protein [Vicinamibacterales bacterium]|nr:ferritin family protein [Vicinamibacterales bacterium]
MTKAFKDLTEREILALAISLEEEHERIYADYVEGFRDHFPATAQWFETMRGEESGHRRRLIDLYRERFGEHIPLIRRHDVKGFVQRPAVWLTHPLRVDAARGTVEAMELEVRRFYERAAGRVTDAKIRQLLSDLALEERKHVATAETLDRELLPEEVRHEEDETKRRLFVLQIVQPALAGLMDGSVSTLAPLFAAAFATRDSWDAFLVGVAASVGAGISMGFAEALSDDGSLTGRGQPTLRGAICGLMTTVGGIGHTLPFLIPNFGVAMAIAVAVVALELAVISWIRYRFMDTPLLQATFQVVVGGVLVFISGILIGSA